MDLRDFNYVNAIAKYQNITKAAESLFITQPTLSKFLINLEKDLGLQLFKRIGHRYIPTYAGERFLDAGNRILLIKGELDAELFDMQKNNRGVLNVGFPTMRMSYFLPHVLPKFKAKYPNIKVNVFEGQSSHLDKLVLEGDADVVFYSMPQAKNPNLTYEVLGKEELLICTPQNHPVHQYSIPSSSSSYPSLDPIHLQNEKLLSMMSGQRTRQFTDNFIKERKLNFQNTMYSSNIRAILDMVAVGYGVTFMFEPHILHSNLIKPISLYRISPQPLLLDFVASRRSGAYIPQYMRDFIQMTNSVESIQHLK